MILDACPIAKDPFAHQLTEWRLSRDLSERAVLWEMGVGKTKLDIDTSAWLYSRGQIEGKLVLAPSGVHRNWVTEEMPAHWPSELGDPAMLWYRSKSADTKWHQKALDEVIHGKGHFSLLAMTYDALLTEEGKKAAKAFLTSRRCEIVADESGRIKNPSAKRTKIALKAALHAPYRRILNGTPVPNGAFDIYSQIAFLEPSLGPRGSVGGKFWERHGITSFAGFKAQFGEWGRGYCYRPGPDGQPKRCEFPELIGYRNLDMLYAWLKEIATRLTKEDAGLNLPPKLYRRITFDLSAAQRRVYDQLRDECLSFLDSGHLVTTTLALTKLLRLQQVACGYVPVDDPDDPNVPIYTIGEDRPRLDMLMEVVEDTPHSAIIWARFRRDVDEIMAAMAKAGKSAVRYDGAVDDEGLAAAADKFKRGEAQFFVSNPAKGGEGLTLLGDQRQEHLACKTAIYYSNSYSLLHRLQSEDRCHRIGQKWPVQYIDLTAADTVDMNVIENLRAKVEVAAAVTGDKLREWIAA